MQTSNNQISIEEQLLNSDYVIRPFKGTSMLPLLDSSKDFVKLNKDISNINIDDVVLYKSIRNSYVLHRIYKIKKNKYFIVGDNCKSGEWVLKDKILAKMQGYYKNDKYIDIKSSEYLDYVSKIDHNYKKRKLIDLFESEYYLNTFISIIYLLRKTLNQYDKDIDMSTVSLKALINYSKAHKVMATISHAILETNIDSDYKKKFLEEYNKTLRRTVLFDEMRNNIYHEFDNEKIRYTSLKGIKLNKMYPINGSREFSDNDILIDPAKTKEVDKIMLKYGFKRKGESSVHIAYLKEPIYNIEIHKTLFENHIDNSKYFNSFYKRAIRVNENTFEYELKPLDFYIYNLAHFKKHYTNSGAGLRSFLDQYILYKNLSDDDKTKLNDELIKAKLKNFSDEVMDIAFKMFETDPRLIDRDKLVYISKCGAYGTMENYISNNLKEYGKFKYFMRRLFPDYSTMKIIYPILKKIRLLLPLCWFLRLLTGVISSDTRKRVGSEFKTAAKYNEKEEA